MKLRQPPADTCFCQLPKLISITQLFLSVIKAESGLNMQISTVENQVLKSSNAILIFEWIVNNIWNVFVIIVFEKWDAQFKSKQILILEQSNRNEGRFVSNLMLFTDFRNAVSVFGLVIKGLTSLVHLGNKQFYLPIPVFPTHVI